MLAYQRHVGAQCLIIAPLQEQTGDPERRLMTVGFFNSSNSLRGSASWTSSRWSRRLGTAGGLRRRDIWTLNASRQDSLYVPQGVSARCWRPLTPSAGRQDKLACPCPPAGNRTGGSQMREVRERTTTRPRQPRRISDYSRASLLKISRQFEDRRKDADEKDAYLLLQTWSSSSDARIRREQR